MPSQIKWSIVLLSGLWLTGCKENPPPSRGDVIGVYMGNYLGGREVYDIRPDGTFSQTFVKDGKTAYSSTGTWKVMASPHEGGNLEFSPHMRAQDWSDSGESVRLDTGNGTWDSSGNKSRETIYFFSDMGIWVAKQKKTKIE